MCVCVFFFYPSPCAAAAQAAFDVMRGDERTISKEAFQRPADNLGDGLPPMRRLYML